MDDETKRIVENLWRGQFCPVASRLLQRVEAHLTDLEPIHGSTDYEKWSIEKKWLDHDHKNQNPSSIRASFFQI